MSLQKIKNNNKNTILHYLYKVKGASKKDIAKNLKLSQSLLTKLSTELLNENKIVYLEKKEEEIQRRGPKELLLGINSEYGHIIGVIINHIETTIILANTSFCVKDTYSFPTEKEWKSSLVKTKESIDNILKKNSLNENNILGIGITLKGLTDGISSLYGIWKEPVNIFDFFSKYYKVKIIIENGIRANAILEKILFDSNDFIFIKYFEAGIGGALVKDSNLLYGENNLMLDFGHMIMNPDLEKCSLCQKNGCLESMVSIEKIRKYAKNLYGRKLELNEIMQKFEAKDENIEYFIKDIAKTFSIALINALSIIDVKKVKLSGEIFKSLKFQNQIIFFLEKMSNFKEYREVEFLIEEKNFIPAVALIVENFMFYQEN